MMRYRRRDIERRREEKVYVCRDSDSDRLYISNMRFSSALRGGHVTFLPCSIEDGCTCAKLNLLSGWSPVDLCDVPEGCQAEIEISMKITVYDKDGNYVSNADIERLCK